MWPYATTRKKNPYNLDMQTPLYRRIALKIGSNVLTRPDGTLDITTMSALVDQVALLRKAGVEIAMISSGAVAAGRSELRNMHIQLDSVSARQLYSSVGQAKLINRYYELFREHGLTCGQVLTLKESFATRRHYLNQKNCMEVMLSAGIIPVVNENDTVSVTDLMFTDNDELSGLVASMLGMQALVILSNVDGVFTGNPSDPESRLIRTVQPGADISGCISRSRSSMGRGGMDTKYRTATKIAAEGIAVMIASGKRPGIVTSLLGIGPEPSGSVPHTLFMPGNTATSQMKKWLAHSEDFAKGILHVNDGAAQAMLDRVGTSLLPVGETYVEGNFEKDDIVQVKDPAGTTIAWGRSGCDAATAREAIGCRDRRPLIHADYLYTELNT